MFLPVLWAPGVVRAQDPAPPATAPTAAPAAAPEPRSTGLPGKDDWTFHFDAGWGAFGFANSLYTDPHEGVVTSFGTNWMEGFIKPALAWTHTFSSSGELYGK